MGAPTPLQNEDAPPSFADHSTEDVAYRMLVRQEKRCLTADFVHCIIHELRSRFDAACESLLLFILRLLARQVHKLSLTDEGGPSGIGADAPCMLAIKEAPLCLLEQSLDAASHVEVAQTRISLISRLEVLVPRLPPLGEERPQAFGNAPLEPISPNSLDICAD